MTKRTTPAMPEHNADPSKVIDWFDYFFGEDEPANEYRYLSNFYRGDPIHALGREWMDGEHLFAALKATTHEDFLKVANAKTPSETKALGRTITLREDWAEVRLDVMRWVLSLKFTLDRPEGRALLETGDAMLIEGTWWNDTVWGLDRETGMGRNWLGTLLMARRAELRAEVAGAKPFDYTYVMETALGLHPSKPRNFRPKTVKV